MANDWTPDGQLPVGESVRMEAFTAERMHLYVTAALSKYYPGLGVNAKFQAHQQASIDNMVMTITSWCASGRIPSSEVVEHAEWPDGVWQMFKSRYMPYWFVEKFPVRMARQEFKTVVNHYFVCPHLQVPDHGPHIQFMATGTRTAERMSR